MNRRSIPTKMNYLNDDKYITKLILTKIIEPGKCYAKFIVENNVGTWDIMDSNTAVKFEIDNPKYKIHSHTMNRDVDDTVIIIVGLENYVTEPVMVIMELIRTRL